MIKLILADAELQLVPQEYRNHPSVRAAAKRRGKKTGELLMDTSLFYSAVKDRELRSRLGRPDIVHFYLMLALDSIANLDYDIEIYVHTRENKIINVSRTLRLPKNYNRFCGLMENLFAKGEIKTDDGNMLLHMEDGTLDELIAKTKTNFLHPVILHPQGKKGSLNHLFSEHEDISFIIGGFSNGDYISPVKDYNEEILSIHPDELPVWTIISEILVHYELSENGQI